MINFVSNLSSDIRTGGFTARNAAALGALRKVEELFYVGPVDPPIILAQKVASKALRLSGLPGDFYFFSRRRLETIAQEVQARCRPDARLDFFHGFTPWILTCPPRPYVAWNDCTFHDYINIYHRREEFRAADLARIEEAEAVWLKRAQRVILRSEWGAKRAIDRYGLDPGRVASVGNFGEIDPPPKDVYAGGRQFVFMSTNFEAKGGPVVLDALRQVRKRHQDASLAVVGDRPAAARDEPGVAFLGLLRKEVPVEAKRLRQVLGGARALVHPTKSDTNPATLVEAGYFGCPVIASRSFAIPEVVDDGRTGLLLDHPSQPDAVAAAMVWMLEQDEAYVDMRRAAWSKTRRHHTKAQFEEDLVACVEEVFVERVVRAP